MGEVKRGGGAVWLHPGLQLGDPYSTRAYLTSPGGVIILQNVASHLGIAQIVLREEDARRLGAWLLAQL